MNKHIYNIIGVMSGTSLDGVDLSYVQFSLSGGNWKYRIITAETIPYSDKWVTRLKEAVDYTTQQLQQLNNEYTVLLSDIIRSFIAKHKISGIDALSSHGHTILHQPQKGITLQIGNLPQIATLTGQKVVCDFRVQDVAMGGQGAPLVPIGDALLFADYTYCLNLGGFANISFEEHGKRLAYDICAVNTVLNFYSGRLGYPYDNGGKIARGGKLNNDLLFELESLEFYNKPYPKSLGVEFVKATVLPLLEQYNIPTEDKLHTYVAHVASQIAQCVATPNCSLLITGGGVYNTFLIEKIQALLPGVAVVLPNDDTIQYKEALIFALLGVLKLRGEINVLASVTGAQKNHSSGKIYST
ncbi:anhydro-N-acetylmuramic acid kinase [Flavobacterium rhizosphaerae]|uniref:Anhydro-N-acetylmuramic acid kinase n=1 Tax=Flavobacterium rhizosphaerae TaxID=3163298 RepID=A0ABW8YYG7_9FLAO